MTEKERLATNAGCPVADSKYTKAKIFSKVCKKTDPFARFTTVAGALCIPMGEVG